MKYTYEVNENQFGQNIITKTSANGLILFIPADLANSDYQAYLKSLEHLTEIPTE